LGNPDKTLRIDRLSGRVKLEADLLEADV